VVIAPAPVKEAMKKNSENFQTDEKHDPCDGLSLFLPAPTMLSAEPRLSDNLL